jgi:hypothetical protein
MKLSALRTSIIPAWMDDLSALLQRDRNNFGLYPVAASNIYVRDTCVEPVTKLV